MVNLKHELTVDDLIVEYMMYKVRNGYEPQFFTSEFIDFLHFFENKMNVEDALYDGEELFKRFFDRKIDADWSITNWTNKEKIARPHMDMEYNDKYHDYVVKANYMLSEYDRSVINTYFMDYGSSRYEDYKGTPGKIRNVIGEYLSNQSKRSIDKSIEIEEKDLLIGKYLSAEIVIQIWDSFIQKQIQSRSYPRQCQDIFQYLFDIDLCKIIGIKSIKEELIEVYNTLSKKIAKLYHLDRNLKVNSYENGYLARANYDLLIQGYEKLFGIAVGKHGKNLEFNLSSLTFKESHQIDGVYAWDDDPDAKTTSISIGNDVSKKLVERIEKENK